MGNIVVSLDSTDKISTITQNNLNFTQTQLDSYKNYLNTYGVIKVTINYNLLKKYIENYINTNFNSLTFTIATENKNNIINTINKGIFMATQILTASGYCVFNNINSNSFNPLLAPTLAPTLEPTLAPTLASTLYQPPTIKDDTINNASMTASDQVVQENEMKHSSIQDMPSNILNIDMIIPKVLFTASKKEFITFLINNFNNNIPERQFINDKHMQQFVIIINQILDSLNQAPDIEIKITNIIGILIKSFISLIVGSISQPPSDNILPIFTNIVIDVLQSIPADSCMFKQNKLDFMQIGSNICNNPIIQTTPQVCPTLGAPPICPTLATPTSCPTLKPTICPTLKPTICPTLGAPPICPTLATPTSCPTQKVPDCLILSSNLIFVIAILVILVLVFSYLVYNNIQLSKLKK